jgi:diaminopimelate epimerase
MVSELRLVVGSETGDAYGIVVDTHGSVDSATFDYRQLAQSADVLVGGFVRLVPIADTETAWFMDCRNTDRSPSPMLTNGIRVAASHLVEAGLVAAGPGDRFTIGTGDGVKDIQAGSGGLFRIDLGRWKFGERGATTSEVILGGLHTVTVVGSLAELERVDLATESSANVANHERVFVAAEEQLIDDGIGRLRYRIVRPGVGEVASSGSGAAAAALVMRHSSGASLTHNWRAESTGGSIGVQMFPTEEGEHVGIHGHAELNHIHKIAP